MVGTRSARSGVAHFDAFSQRGHGRDALPRDPRQHVSRFFLLLLRTRTCAIGAEAFSLSCFSIGTFFGRAAPDRAGARPYQAQRPRGKCNR